MRTQLLTRRASALPLDLIAQAIPKLTRRDLESLTERLIDRLDEIDGDADLEDADDDCAVDDQGCDNAEQGDVEDDPASRLPLPIYGADQRKVLAESSIGLRTVFQH